jgi:HD-GYP domain-containing protein (c-di-GMP phosphodiesterase class II)
MVNKKVLLDWEMFDILKETRHIPTCLYNKDGQVLIYPQTNISDTELVRLENFTQQGIYFHQEEKHIITSDVNTLEDRRIEARSNSPQLYDGLSDEKLIEEKAVKELSTSTLDLMEELKATPLLEMRSSLLRKQLKDIFTDFENHPQAMDGLVNIIDVLGGMDILPAPEIAMKRTIVSMALKTRGFKAAMGKDRKIQDNLVSNLMLSSMLCDVGYLRMKPPTHRDLSDEEMEYIRMHPLYSYMLIVHDETLDPRVKYNVLSHHRPLTEHGVRSNNYPHLLWMREKFKVMKTSIKDPNRRIEIGRDIDLQLKQMSQSIQFDEDLSILAISSEFASLTTRTEWREAFSPERAIRMIINNAFFTYPDRIVRDFLDHISVSLSNNQKILKNGDLVVMSSFSSSGKAYWEVGHILESSRWQSKPQVRCLATVNPQIAVKPKLNILGFDPDSVKPLNREIMVKLEQEHTRRIIYAIDPDYDAPLYEKLHGLVS